MYDSQDLVILSLATMAFGLYALIKGGIWTVDAGVYIAKRFNISTFLIGFTIVAFGTSLPELIVSINANVDGFPDIALGNVVGSNITNILLIVGLTASIRGLYIDSKPLQSQALLMMLSTTALAILMHSGTIERWHGLVMFLTLVVFVAWSCRTEQKNNSTKLQISKTDFSGDRKAFLFLVLGLLFLWMGSEALIAGTLITARTFGISEGVISLTVIALGTSLPELAASISAAFKKQNELIIGNIIGSNVFNVLFVLGVTTMIKPITVDLRLFLFGTTVMLGMTSLFGVWIVNAGKVDRVMGRGFLVAYLIYVLYLAALGLS